MRQTDHRHTRYILGSVFFAVLICLSLPGCRADHDHQADHPPGQTNGNIGKVTRFGSVIKLKPEKYDLYRELHANPWSGVDSLLKIYHIRNYSIYYRDGYLFSYYEYTGDSLEFDMTKLGAEPITREWWKLTDPCQEPVESAAEGEWWAPMEELYHLD